MKVICDTNVFIRLFNQDSDTVAELTKIGSQNVLLPSVSLMELIAGMQNKKEMSELQKKIKNYNILHINHHVSLKATNLMRDFRLSHSLQIPDALIGAMAITYGLELYTYNLKDFRFMPGIKLYAYAHI